MTPDERVREAYAHLRARRYDDTLRALLDASFPDRPAAQGRVHAFRAQALEGQDRLDDAEREAAEAVRQARRAGDTAGLTSVRALHQRILQAIATRTATERERVADAALVDVPDEVLLTRAADDAGRAALLVRRANALVDAGRPEEATHSIHLAVCHAREAGSPRDEVLALLCALRATPGDAERIVHEAHAVADAADDPNLLTAVAKAAAVSGVRLTAPAF